MKRVGVADGDELLPDFNPFLFLLVTSLAKERRKISITLLQNIFLFSLAKGFFL